MISCSGLRDGREGRCGGVVGRHVRPLPKDLRHQEGGAVAGLQRYTRWCRRPGEIPGGCPQINTLDSRQTQGSVQHRPLVVVLAACRSPAGGQPVHQSHHAGSRPHPAGLQERRGSGDRQERTHDAAGAGGSDCVCVCVRRCPACSDHMTLLR